jgi:hypothetical protein
MVRPPADEASLAAAEERLALFAGRIARQVAGLAASIKARLS